MFNVKNKITVPYSTEQMFFLVNDVSSYSDFIPGCIASHILMKDNCSLIAKMDICRCGVSSSLITQNFIVQNHRIIVKLVNGPLKSLFGVWTFIYLTEYISKVEYDFSCEFQSIIFERIFSYVIKRVINEVINAFIFRANKIYNIV